MRNSNTNIIPYVISYVIVTGLIIGGIASIPRKEQCEITNTYHVHRFSKNTENTTISRWINDEKKDNDYTLKEKLNKKVIECLYGENDDSYTKEDIYLPATTTDLEAFDQLDYKDLFDGKENIDFINYQIKQNTDYLKFYYYYEDTYYKKTKNGNTIAKTEKHSGWTTNRYQRGVTGETRVYHTRYYAYKLVFENGKLKVKKSRPVDDVREILNEYPYISEDSNGEVHETFYFSRYDVLNVNVKDITPFYTPTVENNPLKEDAPQYMKKR